MANSEISAPLQIREITVVPQDKTTHIHISYPSGFTYNNSMIIDISARLFDQWYCNADRVFDFLVSCTGSYIDMGMENMDDRLIGKTIKLMLIHL